MQTSPTCFISYSHESDDHRLWVKKLAAKLRQYGVETRLDQWHAIPGDQLPEFMEKEIRESDYVLVICTPKYKFKSDTRSGGVGYEGDIITSEIFVNRSIRKFIPILRGENWAECSPTYLLGKLYINFSDEESYLKNFEELLKTLLNTREQAPPIGTLQESQVGRLAKTQKEIDRGTWVKFELSTLPVLNDNYNNRNNLIRVFRDCLINIYKESYISFSIMLDVKHHNVSQKDKVASYTLFGHQRAFIFECGKVHKAEMTELITARLQPDWQDSKQRLIKQIGEHEGHYADWQIIHHIDYEVLPVALNIEYDPNIKRITILSDDKMYTDPKMYDNEIKTTSEVIRFTCALIKKPHAYVGDIGYQVEFLPLLKLMIEFLDKRSINMDCFRCQNENPEEWDYINYEFQARLKGFN